jgi:hypothetical protein
VTVNHPELGRLRVPHPLAYVVQKTRIRKKRHEQHKQARDQADAFYVLLGFREAWPAWRMAWDDWSKNPEWSSWLADTAVLWKELYAAPTSPGVREVSQVPEYSTYSAADVVRIMAEFQHHIVRH